jgi:hypothetical protein
MIFVFASIHDRLVNKSSCAGPDIQTILLPKQVFFQQSGTNRLFKVSIKKSHQQSDKDGRMTDIKFFVVQYQR